MPLGILQHESDEALVARAVSLEDASAFEALMRRHQQRVHYLLLRFTRDRSVAEELCQETFLRAWRKLATFQASGPFHAWLARLAYNVFLQYRRRPASRMPTSSLDDPHWTAPDDALTVAGSDAELPDLERLLGAVSPAERELLVLSYAGGLSATEIADMLNTSPGTVKSQIHRAKDKIRRQFAIEAAS